MSAYLEQMRYSIRRLLDAEQRFAERQRYLERAFPGAEAYRIVTEAPKDRRRQDAIDDCRYYGMRAQVFALAHLAEQGGPVVVPAPQWPLDSSCAPEGGVYRGEVR